MAKLGLTTRCSGFVLAVWSVWVSRSGYAFWSVEVFLSLPHEPLIVNVRPCPRIFRPVGSVPRFAPLETESAGRRTASSQTVAAKARNAKRPAADLWGPGVNWWAASVRRKSESSPIKSSRSRAKTPCFLGAFRRPSDKNDPQTGSHAQKSLVF